MVGFIDVLLVVAVAVLWFEVPLRGSLLLLLCGCVTYLLCTLGLGLFVSTISSTQQQAMMTATFFFLVPMVYLSGFIFPIENMPTAIQWATTIIPLRYFLGHRPWHFPEGHRVRGAVAAIRRPGHLGLTVIALAAVRSRKRA
jgi:ABC-2 type transport system permease protein